MGMIFRDSGIGGKTAIVTGGGRGIGREIVMMLAAEGADVTFFYLKNRETAEALQAECGASGFEVTALPVDVRNAEDCGRAVESVLDRTDRVDILVNNAGVIRDNLLPAFTEEEISDVLATNVLGVFHITGAVAPVMMRQRGGVIINISSVSGEKGGKGQTNYAASKGAINAFTRALAVEESRLSIEFSWAATGPLPKWRPWYVSWRPDMGNTSTEKSFTSTAVSKWREPSVKRGEDEYRHHLPKGPRDHRRCSRL
jgi:3-oxoacyl-[acyl-carrier protein] reductase